MGGAASVEMVKPLDASDIHATGSLEIAASEVRRLRGDLGHLAKQAGIDIVVYDASDILLGDEGDFQRCVDEISHIRRLCALNTNTSRRKTRQYNMEDKPVFVEPVIDSNTHDDDGKDDDSDDTSSTGSRGA